MTPLFIVHASITALMGESMKLRKCGVGSPGIVVISLVATMITAGCGSSRLSSQVAATQNPLVAQYNISAPGSKQGWVEFGVTTDYGRQTSAVEATGPGNILDILVAGMKANTTYHMRAHAILQDGSTWVDQDRTFTTGALPASAAATKFSVAPPAAGAQGLASSAGVELLSLVGLGQSPILTNVVTDLQGNVIWYCPQRTLPVKPMQNGHYLLNLATDLVEVDLTCNTIRDVSVAHVNQSLQAGGYDFTIPPSLGEPGGGQFHHDMLVLPNGHWIALCQLAKTFTDLPGYPGTTQVVGDAVVDIDLNGDVVWAWNSFDHLDVNRHPYFGLPDWTHSNALVYTADGNLLLSMRGQSWILKLDYANGKGSGDILWKLGPGGDFAISGGDPTQWFYAQHYPNVLSSNGSLMTLAVYDDGNARTDSTGVQCGSSATAPVCYSRAAIFQVDTATNLATPLWQDLPGFFSFWGGSIDALSNGDVEFASSQPSIGPPVILEVTHTSSPQVVWQMNINGAHVYRGYRIPSLYPGVTWKQ